MKNFFLSAALTVPFALLSPGASSNQAIDDERPVAAPTTITNDLGVAKIGRTTSYNPSTTNNDYCGTGVSFDIEVTDKGRDLLGLKLIDPATGALSESINVPAPVDCVASNATTPDYTNPNSYVEVEMTANGLKGRSAVYEVFIVRDGVRNKADPIYPTQPISTKLGYVFGESVSNPIIFNATGTADAPQIDLAAADGTMDFSVERRESTSLVSDCSQKIIGVFVYQNANTGAGLWSTNLPDVFKTPLSGYSDYIECGQAIPWARISAYTAGTDADGIRVQITSSTPSGTKFWEDNYYDIVASGTLVSTPPVIDIINPANGSTYSLGDVPALDLDCGDDPASLISCDVNGYSDQLGTHTVTVEARSWGGISNAVSTYTISEAIDVDPPVVTISGVTDGVTFPIDGTSYIDGEAPVVTCEAIDAVEGAVDCEISGVGLLGEGRNLAWVNTGGIPQTSEWSVTESGGTFTQASSVNEFTVETVEYVSFVSENTVCFGGAVTESLISTWVGRYFFVVAQDGVNDYQRGGLMAAGVTTPPTFCTSPDFAGNTPISGSGDIVIGYGDYSLGDNVITATASDSQGNTGSATVTVTNTSPVTFGTGEGDLIIGPVTTEAVNLGKANRAFPIMFNVYGGGGVEITDPNLLTISIEPSFECYQQNELNDVEQDVDNQTLPITYDEEAGQFKSKFRIGKNGAGCYKLTIAMADGSGEITAMFDLD